MKTLAAVLVETGRPLELVELGVPALGEGQVLVELAYSGVCHTQLLEARGHRGDDPFLPHCLGHEGSGRVVDTGPGVTKVKPGDAVITSWLRGAGLEAKGPLYDWDGRRVNAGGITTFQRHAVMSENRLTVVPDGLDPQDAALLGCAAATGFGVVANVAQPSPGTSLAVFGCGGIGLCAVAAAAAAGCAPLLAIDPLPEKLALARTMGATATVQAGVDELPTGLDLAIEATGRPEVMAQALAAVRPRGGAAVVIGNARFGSRLDLDPKEFNLGKRLLGTWGGDTDPDRDFPRYARLLTAGRVDLSPLRTRVYPLQAVNDALDDLEAGRAARPLLRMD